MVHLPFAYITTASGAHEFTLHWWHALKHICFKLSILAILHLSIVTQIMIDYSNVDAQYIIAIVIYARDQFVGL